MSGKRAYHLSFFPLPQETFLDGGFFHADPSGFFL